MGDNYKKGRGAQFNSDNRFQARQITYDNESLPDDDFSEPVVKTQYLTEFPKQIISRTNSPDVHNATSVNPYQGCEHGCIYCYARPSHEFWGFSAGLDFESRIMVKKNAPALLEKQFQAKSYKPDVIHLSGNTDCYQPAEQEFGLTRQLLKLCLRYRHPVDIITKNALILRDVDILRQLASLNLVHVIITLTTLNEKLRLVMEPRTVTATRRLRVMQQLTDAGIPVGVMTSPIIPSLTDHEIPALIEAAAQHGAHWAGYTVVRLNGSLEPLFDNWLRANFSDRADRVMNQIRACHGGRAGDSRFGTRMSGEGPFADQIRLLHRVACRRFLAGRSLPALDLTQFRPGGRAVRIIYGLGAACSGRPSAAGVLTICVCESLRPRPDAHYTLS